MVYNRILRQLPSFEIFFAGHPTQSFPRRCVSLAVFGPVRTNAARQHGSGRLHVPRLSGGCLPRQQRRVARCGGVAENTDSSELGARRTRHATGNLAWSFWWKQTVSRASRLFLWTRSRLGLDTFGVNSIPFVQIV